MSLFAKTPDLPEPAGGRDSGSRDLGPDIGRPANSNEPPTSPLREPVSSWERDVAALHPPLTDRQLECLCWISKGKSSTDIGQILRISGRTVDYHVSEICDRLAVRTRMQAVAQAIQRGWLTAC